MVITSRSIEIDREQHARTRHNWHVRCMRTFCLLPPPSSVWHAGSAALLLSYRYPPRGATRTPPHGSWGPRTAHERPQRVAMQARVPFGSRFASRDLPVRWARVRGARENRVRGSPVSAVCCVCVVCVCVCVRVCVCACVASRRRRRGGGGSRVGMNRPLARRSGCNGGPAAGIRRAQEERARRREAVGGWETRQWGSFGGFRRR